MNVKELRAAIICINWNYGCGDILSIDIVKQIVTRKPFSCHPEYRKYRVKGSTVYFLGHQKTL
jgi:hypothetical protein